VDNPRPDKLHPDWKKLLAKTLLVLGIIKEEYHGQLTIDLSCGGIGSIRRTETLK